MVLSPNDKIFPMDSRNLQTMQKVNEQGKTTFNDLEGAEKGSPYRHTPTPFNVESIDINDLKTSPRELKKNASRYFRLSTKTINPTPEEPEHLPIRGLAGALRGTASIYKRSEPHASGANTPVKNSPLRPLYWRQKYSIHDPEELGPQESLHSGVGSQDGTDLLMIGEIEVVDIKRELRLLLMASLTASMIVIPFVIYDRAVQKSTTINGHSLLAWAMFVIFAAYSHPLTRFFARLFSYTLTQHLSSLLFRGNALYFLVALHNEIGAMLWSLVMLSMWIIWLRDEFLSRTKELVWRFLACHLAARVGILVKNMITLYIATIYLWRPYLQRVRSSIFAQYALLLLMDFCTKGTVNTDDETFALTISDERLHWNKLSLYAVSKAITFIPRHKLRNTLGEELSLGKTLQSASDAEALAKHLFAVLRERSMEFMELSLHPGSKSKVRKSFIKSELSWSEKLRGSAQHMKAAMFESPSLTHVESETLNGEPQKRHSLGGMKSGTGLNQNEDHMKLYGKSPVHGLFKKSTAKMFVIDSKTDLFQDDIEGSEKAETISSLKLESFCVALRPQLREKVFSLFDMDGNGSISCEEVVASVVRIFRNHQSLALTLRDSQLMAHKLGEVIGFLIFLLVAVSWLIIFQQDLQSVILTFLTALVAISFLIGPSSANLVQSVIFIFIMRPYDVGDRVFHWIPESRKMMNSIVIKIDLQVTHFRSWDDQVYYLPNSVLATRTIINIQRSGDQWHEFFIQILASTPSHKIWELKKKCQDFTLSKTDKPSGLLPQLKFSLIAIENTNKLTIRICFRQKGNWQVLNRKWAVQSLCIDCIKRSCDELGITYSMPAQPIEMSEKDKFL